MSLHKGSLAGFRLNHTYFFLDWQLGEDESTGVVYFADGLAMDSDLAMAM